MSFFPRLLRLITLGGLAVLAALLVIRAGSRGFLAFDQSILFDGGYRTLLGQVPYRDFYIPTGPVPFWLQALFFKLFSVSYSSYLFHAAFANALAAVLAYKWIRLLYPCSGLYASLAGIITAFWFYPPFGTPWFEQTAFLCHLIASVLLFKGFQQHMAVSVSDAKRPSLTWFVAAGFMAGLAFLSKQNVGLLSVFACGSVILLASPVAFRVRLRQCLALAAGLMACSLIFGAWLWRFSHPGHFWEFFFVIPSGEGMRRIAGGWFSDLLLEEFSLAGANRATLVVSFVVATSALVVDAGSRWVKQISYLDPRQLLAATTIVSLFSLQALFIHLTINEPELGFPFCGVILILAVLLARDLLVPRDLAREGTKKQEVQQQRLFVRTLLSVLALAASWLLMTQGWEVAMSRRVHDIFWRSEFREEAVSKALSPVKWAIPTRAARRSQETISVDDVDNLAVFLAEEQENFFIFPDFTLMYGLTGKVPPQPILWFHRGLTYSSTYSATLDHRIVRDLIRNEVEYVVLEKDSFRGTRERLSHFPVVERYIQSRFQLLREIGIFQIHKRIEAGS